MAPSVARIRQVDAGARRRRDEPQHGVSRAHRHGAPVEQLVRAARSGDHRAWELIVDRTEPMLRSIARSYRLSPSDVDDVVQTSWLQLLSHIDRIHDPAAVDGWLATTTRRSCLRLLQRPMRECPADPADLCDDACTTDPASGLLAAERRCALNRAFATLPERHRRLMTLLLLHPHLDYRSIGGLLAMPVGSIGPIRARSLMRLRRDPDLAALASTDCR